MRSLLGSEIVGSTLTTSMSGDDDHKAQDGHNHSLISRGLLSSIASWSKLLIPDSTYFARLLIRACILFVYATVSSTMEMPYF